MKQQSKRDEANKADRKPSFLKRNGKFKSIYKNFRIKKTLVRDKRTYSLSFKKKIMKIGFEINK